MIYKWPRYFLSSFESIGLLVQKKDKINFQNGGHGGHLGFLIRKILANFYLQDTLILPTKFHVNRPFTSGEESKKYTLKMAAILDFQSVRFYLFWICKLSQCYLSSLKSVGLLFQEKKLKIDFQDGGHLGLSIQMTSAFFIYKFESVGYSVLEKKHKIDFQDGG